MNLSQAIELANSFSIPGFLTDDASLDEERRNNEEAISLLRSAWMEAPKGKEPFSFDLVRSLADRNRRVCDDFGVERLERAGGMNLARRLSDDDLVRGVAWMQGRRPRTVAKEAGPEVRDLGIAMLSAPIKRNAVIGFDMETTSTEPDRGYIINIGLAIMELTPDAVPSAGHVAYFGIPDIYSGKGVPGERIHHIRWSDLEGKKPFREDAEVQKALLKAFTSLPMMAHNAAFEDSWLMLNLDGYEEARKAGKVIIIDSRDICRRVDVEVRTLPRESAPASLENWARRRGTLKRDEKEVHLGLDDVVLMLETVQAEFKERNMFPGMSAEKSREQNKGS